MSDGKRSGGSGGMKGFNVLTVLKWGAVLIGFYALVGPDQTSALLSGQASEASLTPLILKGGLAGAVIGVLHLPFPQQHGRGWHIIGWSIGGVVLLLSREIWFPTAVSLGRRLISLAVGLAPPG